MPDAKTLISGKAKKGIYAKYKDSISPGKLKKFYLIVRQDLVIREYTVNERLVEPESETEPVVAVKKKKNKPRAERSGGPGLRVNLIGDNGTESRSNVLGSIRETVRSLIAKNRGKLLAILGALAIAGGTSVDSVDRTEERAKAVAAAEQVPLGTIVTFKDMDEALLGGYIIKKDGKYFAGEHYEFLTEDAPIKLNKPDTFKVQRIN